MRVETVHGWPLAVVHATDGAEVPLIEDTELARRLGYADHKDIRELIKRLEKAVEFSTAVRRGSCRPSTERGHGPLVRPYLLDEDQVITVTFFAKTAMARKLRAEFRSIIKSQIDSARVDLLAIQVQRMTAEIAAMRSSSQMGVGIVTSGQHEALQLRKKTLAFKLVRDLGLFAKDRSGRIRSTRDRLRAANRSIQTRVDRKTGWGSTGQRAIHMPVAVYVEQMNAIEELEKNEMRARGAGRSAFKAAERDTDEAMAGQLRLALVPGNRVDT